VDVNSFLAFGLRRMSFGIGFFAPKAEKYECNGTDENQLSGN
jgi:hypothetical protein